MLTFVTTAVFAIAFIGAISVIAYMFASYRGKIEAVIRYQLEDNSAPAITSCKTRVKRVTPVRPTAMRRQPARPVPFAVAA